MFPFSLWTKHEFESMSKEKLQNIIEIARLNVNLACYSIQHTLNEDKLGKVEIRYLKNCLFFTKVIIYIKKGFNETKGKL